ncbi:MAG: TonB-dependent receptor [Sphingobacteriaceae bacterium]|nr:TonB-dependent receptor [Sphingobacteriaceae bacterium]
MKRLILIYFFTLFIGSAFAQITQTVKGKITDKATGIGLPGVVVKIKGDATNQLGASSDGNGNYKITGVPIGRQTIIFTMMGYKPRVLSDQIITSGKEFYLEIEMDESAQDLAEVEVKADANNEDVLTMQSINVKSFNLEETERYPGSRQDPARAAQNFAGVQGNNDARNDIVVRGNSPAGLLWRLEEVDIPNPNHFAVAGSAGGPQSLINNKYLANSDFYTGAFPANYGNALGAVFDLKMRNGNNEKHERTFQFGFLGTELALEGPLSKKSGASYLITYRYSTLKLFSAVNFNLGTSAVPGYQDIGVRLNFPTKKAGIFTFSGIGGLSTIDIILSKDTVRPRELYGDLNRDQYFRTNMGVGILSHVYSFNSKTLMRTTIAQSGQSVNSKHYQVLRYPNFKPKDTIPNILDYNFNEYKTTLSWFVKHKINSRNSFKTGFLANVIGINFYDKIKINSLYDTIPTKIENKNFKLREEVETSFCLIQPYITYVHKFSDKLTFNAGLFTQLLTLNNKYAIEPRASIKYDIRNNQSISLAYGLHSQMQPTYIYYARPDSIVNNGVLIANSDRVPTNKDLDFSKSQHVVLGYDIFPSKYLRIKTELYYQYLWNIPVYVMPNSTSLLNRGATFTRFFPQYTMVNNGTGYNYGLEFTLEKLFHKHWFLLYSASLFESKYTGSDNKVHNTDFNGNYMMNLLTGLEFDLGKSKKNSISIGSKFTYGGGRRYSPVNIPASNAVMDVIPVSDSVNTKQFAPYNRLDLRLSYKINGKKVSTEIALDILNILSSKNILALSYAPDPANLTKDPLIRNYQLGFLPLLYVKVDF